MSNENATDYSKWEDWENLGEKVTAYKKRNAVKATAAAKSKDGSDSAIRMTAVAGKIFDGIGKVGRTLGTVVTTKEAKIACKVLGCAPLVGVAFDAMLPVLESLRDSEKVGKELISLFEQVNRLINYINEVFECNESTDTDDGEIDETIQAIMFVLDGCFDGVIEIEEKRGKKGYWKKNPWNAPENLKTIEGMDNKIATVLRERSLIDIMKNKKILKGIAKDLVAIQKTLVEIEQVKKRVQTDSLLERVRGCKIISDFQTMYDLPEFQFSLKSIENDQGDGDPEDWAKEWAFKMRSNDEDAWQLNDDRKACLQLLYTMCDCWKPEDKSKATVSKEDIEGKFRDRTVLRIMNLCVVMDRAQALYKMRVTGHPVGMHWYAQKHVDEFDEWKEIDTNYRNLGGLGPLINKRIFWLVDLFHPKGALKCWLEPKEIPHLLVAANQRVDSNISALSDSVAQTKVSDSKPVS